MWKGWSVNCTITKGDALSMLCVHSILLLLFQTFVHSQHSQSCGYGLCCIITIVNITPTLSWCCWLLLQLSLLQVHRNSLIVDARKWYVSLLVYTGLNDCARSSSVKWVDLNHLKHFQYSTFQSIFFMPDWCTNPHHETQCCSWRNTSLLKYSCT